jgi:hypothetical protein
MSPLNSPTFFCLHIFSLWSDVSFYFSFLFSQNDFQIIPLEFLIYSAQALHQAIKNDQIHHNNPIAAGKTPQQHEPIPSHDVLGDDIIPDGGHFAGFLAVVVTPYELGTKAGPCSCGSAPGDYADQLDRYCADLCINDMDPGLQLWGVCASIQGGSTLNCECFFIEAGHSNPCASWPVA